MSFAHNLDSLFDVIASRRSRCGYVILNEVENPASLRLFQRILQGNEGTYLASFDIIVDFWLLSLMPTAITNLILQRTERSCGCNIEACLSAGMYEKRSNGTLGNDPTWQLARARH